MSKTFVLLLIGVLTGAGVYYAKSTSTLDADGCSATCGDPVAGCAAGCSTSGCLSCGLDAEAAEAVVEEVRLGEGDLLAGVPGEGPLTVEQVRAWLADPANHRELEPILPIGLDEGAADLQGLEENPLTRAKIELGRQLFFDPRLSGDGTVSCASCHDPEHGFAFATRFGVGVEGQEGERNSPTAGNRLLSCGQFWDGRAATLEEQAIGPIANPIEMASTHEAAVDFCRGLTGYRLQFERLFEEGVTIENLGKALASFERVVVSGPSPWDHYRRLTKFESIYEGELEELAEYDPELAEEHVSLKQNAEATPLSDAAVRGSELFFSDRTGCTQCHAGANFSDERFHNLGVGFNDAGETDDWGRYSITTDEADRGAFKTPGLRNVAQTAPYMHDGSQETLAEVVAWYVQGGGDNPHLSPLLSPLDLNEQEQADLVAFLEALTGAWPEVESERLPIADPDKSAHAIKLVR